MESHAVETALRWIVLTPLIGAALNGLLVRVMPRRLAGLLACGTVGVSLALAVRVFLRLTAMDPAARVLTDHLTGWIGIGSLKVDIAFAMDPLGAVMALVVTGISFLIHVYSLGYMAHDEGFNRFFAYMNLFVFAMLTLVLGENLVMLFVGWEGVGLCSYLLIGFWFDDEANAIAGKKAFLVNRVGDFGFLLGMFVIGSVLLPHVGPGESVFSFRTMAAHADLLAPSATLIALLLFFGATGKSAQIPLYIWLPDAMAGPTPVSALIHAATMVTAGVYMVARMNFLYVLAPHAMTVVAIVGAATALLAATIAMAQNDIKKVLAYSTVSQLGYMMLACGVGAFAAGIFHVMTHAFFKALLFLGSGSVIHAMSDEQDMRVMGGLRFRLPVTYWTFLAGTFAIAGVFPLAGFFSKDEILWKAFSQGSVWLWVVGFAVAGLTAFYMMRLVTLTFFGENRASEEVRSHIHESPATMTAPLVVLAVLSIAGGWIGWPHFLGGVNRFENFLEPVFHQSPAVVRTIETQAAPLTDVVNAASQMATGEADLETAAMVAHVAAAVEGAGHPADPRDVHASPEAHAAHETHAAHEAHAAHGDERMEWTLAGASLLLALVGLVAGGIVYGRRIDLATTLQRSVRGVPHRILVNKYYVDEFYEATLVRPGYNLSAKGLWRAVDVGLIDGLLVNGSAVLVSVISSLLRLFQNGRLRFYAYVFALGAAAFVLFLFFSS